MTDQSQPEKPRKPGATQKAQGKAARELSDFKQDRALTPKQEAFCLAYLETGNASEAYRQSYSAGRMSDKQIWEEASKLLKHPKVAQRLDALRAPVVEKAQLTLESHLARLQELSRKAEEAEQYSAAITAETNRGKAAGLYTEKLEHSGAGGGPIQARVAIEFVNPPCREAEDA